MGTLTWRDVAAPDFRPAMEGYNQASQLLTNAFSGLQQGLNKFDASKSDQVNKAFALKLAQFNDPAALQAALAADPTLGQDARRLSADAIASTGTRVNTLLDQNMKGLQAKDLTADIDFEGRTRTRQIGQWDATDAARPMAAKLIAAGDDYEAQKKIFDDPANQQLLAALTAPEQFGLVKDATGLVKDDLGIKTDQQNLAFGAENQGMKRTEFGWTKEDRDAQRDGMMFLQSADLSAMTADDLRAAASEAGLTPRAWSYVRSQLGNEYAGAFGIQGGGELGAPGGSAGSSALRVMNYEAAAAGFKSVPASVKTLGQASDFAKQVNRAGVASSAMGVYQIVGATMRDYAPKVLGAGWRDAEYNLQNQDKIAEAIFNDNRGSAQALKNQWVSLSSAEAERVRKMPWAQAREYIAGKESSSSPAALMADVSGRASQIIGNSGARTFAAADQDETPPLVVAQQLIGNAKEPGPLAKWQPDELASEIQRVIARGRLDDGTETINAKQAGQMILQANPEKRAAPGWSNGFGLFETRTGQGDKTLDSLIKEARSGGQRDRAVAADDAGAGAQQILGLRQQAAAARQEYAAYRQRAITLPNSPDVQRNLARYKAKADAAAAALGIAEESAASLPAPKRDLQAAEAIRTSKPKGFLDTMSELFTFYGPEERKAPAGTPQLRSVDEVNAFIRNPANRGREAIGPDGKKFRVLP